MSYYTSQISKSAALLAAVWLILVGAGLTPWFGGAERLAIRFFLLLADLTVREALATARSEILKSAAIAFAAAIGISCAAPVPAAAQQTAAVTTLSSEKAPASAALDATVTEAFLSVTAKGAKPLPVWLLDSAIGIYTAYKTYRNGEKFEEAARVARAALDEIARVRAETEAGRRTSEHEQRLIRTRLDAQVALIEGLDGRVKSLEQRAGSLEHTSKQLASIVTRRGCPPLHAYDRKLRRCTNRLGRTGPPHATYPPAPWTVPIPRCSARPRQLRSARAARPTHLTPRVSRGRSYSDRTPGR